MNGQTDHSAGEPRRGHDHTDKSRKVLVAVGAGCVLLLIAELFIDKHGEFPIEHWFGFHALFGLGAGLALVLKATILRRLLRRPEDYYYDRR